MELGTQEDRPEQRSDDAPASAGDERAPLRQALAENHFTLFCQPVLGLERGKAFPMAEVLIRLREEETAMLPPGEFFPLYEQAGMMPQLDRWVVKHLVRHLARGSRIARLSMNVAGQTLEDARFPEFVAAELKAQGVAPASVLFEIDEADVLSRTERAVRFGAAMRKLGCGVIVDGFGEHPISPAMKVLRPDFVKVYGSIILTLLTSDASADKLAALAQFCESLGIGMIAECVEDKNVLTGLKALGVQYAQGFGIQPPRAIEAIAS